MLRLGNRVPAAALKPDLHEHDPDSISFELIGFLASAPPIHLASATPGRSALLTTSKHPASPTDQGSPSITTPAITSLSETPRARSVAASATGQIHSAHLRLLTRLEPAVDRSSASE